MLYVTEYQLMYYVTVYQLKLYVTVYPLMLIALPCLGVCKINPDN